MKKIIALNPPLAEVDFHYTQIEARNFFFLKLFREGFIKLFSLIISKLRDLTKIMLVHPDGYAGTIDLVCEIDLTEKGIWGEVYLQGPRKGEPKETLKTRRTIAAVDFKSGRKGFYAEHEIQLESYRSLVKENFPNINIEKIYNWRPTDWKEKPKYAFKDQSDSIEKEKFEAIIAMAKIELLKKEKIYSDIVGTLTLGVEPIDNIAHLDISTYIKLKSRPNK